jgi:hypothetical protein
MKPFPAICRKNLGLEKKKVPCLPSNNLNRIR